MTAACWCSRAIDPPVDRYSGVEGRFSVQRAGQIHRDHGWDRRSIQRESPAGQPRMRREYQSRERSTRRSNTCCGEEGHFILVRRTPTDIKSVMKPLAHFWRDPDGEINETIDKGRNHADASNTSRAERITEPGRCRYCQTCV